MITITDDVKAFKAELDAVIKEEETARKEMSALAASGCNDSELLNLKIKQFTAAHNKKMDIIEKQNFHKATQS